MSVSTLLANFNESQSGLSNAVAHGNPVNDQVKAIALKSLTADQLSDAKKAYEAFQSLLERLSGKPRDEEILITILVNWMKDGRTSYNEMFRAMPYSEYLQTNHWKRCKESTKQSAGYRCMLCNQGGELHTHHRTYENLGCEHPADLICLCSDCHSLFHEHRTADHQFKKAE